MEAPTYLPDTALQTDLPHGSPGFPPNPGFSQVNAEAPPLEEGAPRHECFECGTSYAYRQGYLLHFRTVHNPKKRCILCDFLWVRPYAYGDHLRKNHPGVDADVILGKPAGSHRRATVTEVLPQQPPVSPTVVELGQQNWAESQPNSSSLPSPAPVGDTDVSPPAASSVDLADNNSQPVHRVQTATMNEHECAHGSEFVDVSYPLPMPLSTVERTDSEPVEGISLQDGQFGVPSAHLGASAAMNSPPDPETEPVFYLPLSDAEIEAAYNSIFANIP